MEAYCSSEGHTKGKMKKRFPSPNSNSRIALAGGGYSCAGIIFDCTGMGTQPKYKDCYKEKVNYKDDQKDDWRMTYREKTFHVQCIKEAEEDTVKLYLKRTILKFLNT